MRFIFLYPGTHDADGDMLDAGPVPEVAAAAERANFDGFALTEHPVPDREWMTTIGHQSLDPFVALGCAAAATSRIRLVTYLSVAPYRNPFLLAKAAATVDKLSGGRMILGLGAGYLRTEFDALGVSFGERNALFDETLEVLPLHWSGDPFSYQGRHFEARDVLARPRPVQNPIPIWIGGNSARSRRRVAEKAQGWMPMLIPAQFAASTRTTGIESLDELAGLIAETRQMAEAAGRVQSPAVAHTYMDPTIGQPGREVDRHLEAFAAIEAAGVTHTSVSCSTASLAATVDFVEAFGSAYCAQ